MAERDQGEEVGKIIESSTPRLVTAVAHSDDENGTLYDAVLEVWPVECDCCISITVQ